MKRRRSGVGGTGDALRLLRGGACRCIACRGRVPPHGHVGSIYATEPREQTPQPRLAEVHREVLHIHRGPVQVAGAFGHRKGIARDRAPAPRFQPIHEKLEPGGLMLPSLFATRNIPGHHVPGCSRPPRPFSSCPSSSSSCASPHQPPLLDARHTIAASTHLETSSVYSGRTTGVGTSTGESPPSAKKASTTYRIRTQANVGSTGVGSTPVQAAAAGAASARAEAAVAAVEAVKAGVAV